MRKKLFSVLLLIPLLAACPQVNIETMPDDYKPDLPEFHDKNTGVVKSDDTYAYFDFYEISDFHGAVNYKVDDKELGLARLSTYFDKKREANPGGTFLISSGDMWQGSADSNLTKGTMVTYGMDVMDFDSMTLGNHEFDWTVNWIKNNKERATFPFLCANLIDTSTNEVADFVQKSTVITRGDYKVGVIGTIGDTIKTSILASAVEGYDFADEITTVKAEASRLRSEEGCDIVVWTSHNDAEILKSRVSVDKPDVDAVFGGHSHVICDEEYEGIPFMQSKAYSHAIPHVQLQLDKNTKEVSISYKEVDDNPASREYDEDADIAMIKKQYDDRFINPVKNQWVARIDGDLEIKSTLANFCAYSMKEELKRNNKFSSYPVVATFHNKNGGVRKDIPAGNVLYSHVYESVPFDNEIIILKVTGYDLWFKFINGNNNICYWHSYKRSDVVDEEEYYVLTTDYLLTNSDYYASVEPLETIYTGIAVRDAVCNTLKAESPVQVGNFKTTNKVYDINY